MKLKTVLLRCYKSFHLNYRENPAAWRPWNQLSPLDACTDEFPFIEIPVESDITTIVGANGSGKSHLLNAIAKVIRGTGLDDKDEFRRTDLCHYAGVRTRNVEAWPNIGLQFSIETAAEFSSINELAGGAVTAPGPRPQTFAVVLAPDRDIQNPAHLFIEPNEQPIPLDACRLDKLRKLLPALEFMDSQTPLAGEIPLARLIAAYGDTESAPIGIADRHSIQEAAAILHDILSSPQTEHPVSSTFVRQMAEVRKKISTLNGMAPGSGSLEVQLFKDILGIDIDTLKYLYGLAKTDRGYIEGQIARWNKELSDRLNLEHFWCQDGQFSLSVNYKVGIVYFEIQDKTGSVYTFDERSAGLKFFLSYYIQAKALEMSGRNRNSIILMDEPNSALSLHGQRNLLAVFESQVSAESSNQTCQLIYTTHSPHLINRNFPRRIRVVKKEDSEAGTQYIEQPRGRRYEPVRTALGLCSTPALFLNTDNILLGGPADQFLLTELIRVFARPGNAGEFLDLNSVAVISADGAGNIENVLQRSRWADEPMPPAVIVVDGSAPALKIVARISGDAKNDSKKLIGREFVMTLAELISPFGDNTKILTVEDLIPKRIYLKAIRTYCSRWLPLTLKDHAAEIDNILLDHSFGNDGLAASTKQFFQRFQTGSGGDSDRMGILQEVVTIAADTLSATPADADLRRLRSNMAAVCNAVHEGLTRSRARAARYSTTRTVTQIIHDFDRLNKDNVPITALQKLFRRLEREVSPAGADGESCVRVINEYLVDLDSLRASGQERIVTPQWLSWKARLDAMRRNPLAPLPLAHTASPADAIFTSLKTSALSRTASAGN